MTSKRPVMAWPPGLQCSVDLVVQGDFKATSKKDIVYSTLLGSCVSVCLFDPVAAVGGMNHYLLADQTGTNSLDQKYGAQAMELLINAVLKSGGERHQIKAKIFGGARMTASFGGIGEHNAAFADRYLVDEGFDILARDVGGTRARRLNFHPTTGQVRVMQIAGADLDAFSFNAGVRPWSEEPRVTLF